MESDEGNWNWICSGDLPGLKFLLVDWRDMVLSGVRGSEGEEGKRGEERGGSNSQ